MRQLKSLAVPLLALILASGIGLSVDVPKSTLAQAAWTATVWIGDEQGSSLHIVNGETIIDTIPLSSNLIVSHPYTTREVYTSDDNRYVLHWGYDTVEERRFVRYGETGDGPCCFDGLDLIGDVYDLTISSFEPNGSRFAISYTTTPDGFSNFENFVTVIDASIGQYSIPPMSIAQLQAEINRIDISEQAKFGKWTDDGILFHLTCYSCESPLRGPQLLWRPEPFTVTSESGKYYSAYGDQLERTNELILQGLNDIYFHDPTFGYDSLPSNVVRYYPSGNFVQDAMIVHNNIRVELAYLRWVGDGQAFLVMLFSGDNWDVVYRDGSTATIANMSEVEFLAGTPQGWFVVADDRGIPAVFHYDLTSLQPTRIASVGTGLEHVKIANSPSLGASITAPSFAELPPPNVIQTAQCPGFLPSRLLPNTDARVTPGAANRMRQQPTTSAADVSRIPGGATFHVISGPSCDYDNGIAWWRVEYDGVEGWTAEGQGDTYWTEPVE